MAGATHQAPSDFIYFFAALFACFHCDAHIPRLQPYTPAMTVAAGPHLDEEKKHTSPTTHTASPQTHTAEPHHTDVLLAITTAPTCTNEETRGHGYHNDATQHYIEDARGPYKPRSRDFHDHNAHSSH